MKRIVILAPARCANRIQYGFSLLELLVVVAIIGIMATLAGAGLSSMQRAQGLGSASQMVAAQIQLARQTAAARNLPVEVRFYQLPDFGQSSGSASRWRAVGVFDGSATNAQTLQRPVHFPARVVIEPSPTASPLWTSMGASDAPLPGFGTGNWPYRALTVRPNGLVTVSGTSPAEANWFLSLRQESDVAEPGGLPANFATIQINPFTARTQVLRP